MTGRGSGRRFRTMRVALLSNVTVGVLAEMLAEGHSVWVAPGFGGWMETALAAPDALVGFDPEAIFLLLDSTHAAVDLPSVGTAVAALESAFPRAAVIVPDLDDLLETAASPCDERMWRLASMPWSLEGLRAIRDEIERLLRMMAGNRRKVLAVDFDNTLWRGVVGEDGAAAVEPRADFQRGLRELRERGVLLVGLSKNNADDVEPVWSDPRMVLKRDDFVDLRVDWNGKAENLSASARLLNLGTDAFVFVDDDPAERARMAALHPEVAVPEWPVSVRRLARLYFPRMRVTDEDRARTALYRDEAKRRDLASRLSLDDYLESLEIRTEIHPIAASEIPRVAQLSQKSNQLNACTNRRSPDEIARLAADPNRLLVTLHARDRFGDQGLVAFALARLDGACASIEDFVLSCRAMNRRLEQSLENELERLLRDRGVRTVGARYVRTAKNAPAADLFDRLGFARVASRADGHLYSRSLA